jgi:hypothetical protein
MDTPDIFSLADGKGIEGGELQRVGSVDNNATASSVSPRAGRKYGWVEVTFFWDLT